VVKSGVVAALIITANVAKTANCVEDDTKLEQIIASEAQANKMPALHATEVFALRTRKINRGARSSPAWAAEATADFSAGPP
jgi:hypothetical protein